MGLAILGPANDDGTLSRESTKRLLQACELSSSPFGVSELDNKAACSEQEIEALVEATLEAGAVVKHKVFAELLLPLIKPSICAALQPATLSSVGKAWCLLGLLRLHLLAALPFVDPALQPEIESNALQADIDDWLEPELEVIYCWTGCLSKSWRSRFSNTTLASLL